MVRATLAQSLYGVSWISPSARVLPHSDRQKLRRGHRGALASQRWHGAFRRGLESYGSAPGGRRLIGIEVKDHVIVTTEAYARLQRAPADLTTRSGAAGPGLLPSATEGLVNRAATRRETQNRPSSGLVFRLLLKNRLPCPCQNPNELASLLPGLCSERLKGAIRDGALFSRKLASASWEPVTE